MVQRTAPCLQPALNLNLTDFQKFTPMFVGKMRLSHPLPQNFPRPLKSYGMTPELLAGGGTELERTVIWCE